MVLRRLRGLALVAPLLIGVACGQPNATTPASSTNLESPAGSWAGVVAVPSSSTTTTEFATTTTTWAVTTTTHRVTTTTTQPTLSNNDYYTNGDGNIVHSPAYSTGGAPAGATAQCRDGTYSFSQHHSGTCSSHGGVAGWL